MKNKLFIVIVLMGLTMLFSSCAQFPQAQLDATTAAVDSVKKVGGDLYVPTVYQALVDSLKSANAKAQVDQSKFFRTYKDTKASLLVVNQMASDALVKTEARKVEVKAENDALVLEVKSLLVTNVELLKKAPKGKDGKAALDAISTDLEVVSATLVEVETLSSTGDLLAVNSKLKAAKEKALSIKTELETAISKVKK